MQNFVLLTEVGQTKKPVLLKRGMSATIVDLLMSAEYVLSQGNPNVVLCERGVKKLSPGHAQFVRRGRGTCVQGAFAFADHRGPQPCDRPAGFDSVLHSTGRRGCRGRRRTHRSAQLPGRGLVGGPQALLPSNMPRSQVGFSSWRRCWVKPYPGPPKDAHHETLCWSPEIGR